MLHCIENGWMEFLRSTGASANQQVVSNAEQLLAPSLSPLSSRFVTICQNYYYVFMTAARPP
jgi:hypothetical protein